ncbi:OsmC family protein [Azospirillum sp. sgz302134]
MTTAATMTATMTTEARAPKKTPMPLNGVDTPKLFATIGAVAGQPELAEFQFRAQSRWVKGTHSRSTMSGFSGAGGEHSHAAPFKADADHPAVLCGEDNGPTPVEYLLHALASCLTAGIANIAAARGVTLDEVESTVEGDIDLRGILGLSNEVRNGFRSIRVSFRVKGDAPEAKLREIVEQSRARSAVFDVLTNGVPVAITMND